VDALIDLPLALPTAVAGISLTAIYAPSGILGRYLEPHGIQVAFARLGVVVAMVFVGLPFAVRTVQPVLMDLDPLAEAAAAALAVVMLVLSCLTLLGVSALQGWMRKGGRHG